MKRAALSIKITDASTKNVIRYAHPLLLQIGDLTTVGSPSAEGVQVLVSSEAYSSINLHITMDTSQEVGGFLIGTPYKWQEKNYVEIIDSIPAIASSSSATHLVFSSDEWVKAKTILNEKFPERYLVGWYHTHPKNKLFLSNQDIFIHEWFFRELWQVALVLEPVKKKAAFFIWDNGNIRKSKGYQVLYPDIPYERWVSDN